MTGIPLFYSSDHPIRCPYCDSECDGHLQLPKEQRPKPENEEVTVCRHCGRASVYTQVRGRLALRLPTAEEKRKLLAHPEITAEMFLFVTKEGNWRDRDQPSRG